jgi:hypothetical protein
LLNIDNPADLVMPFTDYLRNLRERAAVLYEEAVRNGQDPGKWAPGKYQFSGPDTIYMIQFWICRCETGHDYFHANPHGPVSWHSAGYDACPDPSFDRASKGTCWIISSKR